MHFWVTAYQLRNAVLKGVKAKSPRQSTWRILAVLQFQHLQVSNIYKRYFSLFRSSKNLTSSAQQLGWHFLNFFHVLINFFFPPSPIKGRVKGQNRHFNHRIHKREAKEHWRLPQQDVTLRDSTCDFMAPFSCTPALFSASPSPTHGLFFSSSNFRLSAYVWEAINRAPLFNMHPSR